MPVSMMLPPKGQAVDDSLHRGEDRWHDRPELMPGMEPQRWASLNDGIDVEGIRSTTEPLTPYPPGS